MPPTEVLTLTIEDLSRGGSGVARESSGRVVFVPLTAPGDRVLARVTDENKRYAQAELVEILEASPLRIVPRCGVFGRCGGCAWQHLPYSLQWKTKAEGVHHALKRAGIEIQTLEEFPAENPWNYRNRIQLRGTGATLGFYARRSHETVPIERCEIADERINAELPATRTAGARLAKAYKVEIETQEGDTTNVRKTWNAAHAAAGFRQIHEAQNAKLQQWIRARILEYGSEKTILYDLFGGSGNLSLHLRTQVAEVHCVDTFAPQESPKETQGARFSFHRSSILPWLNKRARDHGKELKRSFCIIDPPRKGLEEGVEEIEAALSHLHVSHIAAVGCDADSWARDLSRFIRRGWHLNRVASLDFFPQTPHVESVALLEKLTITN